MDGRHSKQGYSVTTLFDLFALGTRRYEDAVAFSFFLIALAAVDTAAQATGQEVEILVGAGLDPGLGEGIYVLHFTHFNLPESDRLVLWPSEDPETTPAVAVLSGKNATGNFHSTAISGIGVVLELFKTPVSDQSSSTSCRGFTVDRLLFTPKELVDEAQHLQVAVKVPLTNLSNTTDTNDNDHINNESLCGADESVEAACAPSATNSAEGAIMLAKSQPVARLSIIKDNGMVIAYCTGWLLGCEGHLITNQHCIGNNQDALNTKVEFLAQSTSCKGGETCDSQGGCPGPIGVTSPTLVAVSEELDYAVVRLGINDSIADYSGLYEKTSGYLQFRASGAVPKESIYIPQHPLGYGKRIAWLYNGQPGRVESLTVTECREDDVGYYIDTQEGASGSPILGTSDHNVIAMHHCGGCLNGGIPAQSIIEDLTTKGVLPKCSVAT
uniref:Serine protease n=2 Tax=Peronospora matthiolae TaxID=2874970 RepID=A0AAV1V7T1_9STRA